MRLRVRTPEGELTFASRLELGKAYAQGLVDPTDEVQEEGSNRWRKAGELPELVQWRQQAAKPAVNRRALGTVLIVAISLLALYLLFKESWTAKGTGVALSLVVAYVLMNANMKSFSKRAR